MNNKRDRILMILVAACLVFISFFAGRSSNSGKLTEQQEQLQILQQTQEELQTLQKAQEELRMLNRYSIENMVKEDGIIYVIGHKSPDSDTVCSAIAYARLLNQLGYEAQAVITAPVNNETAYILKTAEMEIPEILYDASGENIFLVDHSEYAQAVEGMKDAHVVGVIDHHGVGTLNTGNQVIYEGRPIGATATIVWLDYLNYGLDLDPQTAYLLLGAVLSDTDNLTGSTVTQADREALRILAETAGVTDIQDLYAHLHEEKLSYEGMSDMEILFSDYKEYEASGVKFGIGIQNAINDEVAAQLSVRMKEILPEGFKTREVDLMYASVGIRENGEKIDYIIPCDEYSEAVLVDAFPNYTEYDGTAYIYRDGGLGRKTKFVPGLTDYLGTYPQE